MTTNKGNYPKFSVTNKSEDSELKLAVLIDADNAQASIVKNLLEEIAKFGVASVKRIYGDWTQPQLGAWKKSTPRTFDPASTAVCLYQR